MEVVNGPDAGKELFSDEKGTFSYTGMFPGTVSMRATKEGYLDSTSSVFSSTITADAWVGFLLAPLAPPVDMAGNYTLTITADSACTGFPEDERTRSYEARLTRRAVGTLPANTRFDGTVSGALFAPYSSAFFVGVAGDYVTLEHRRRGAVDRGAGRTQPLHFVFRSCRSVRRDSRTGDALGAVHGRHRVLRVEIAYRAVRRLQRCVGRGEGTVHVLEQPVDTDAPMIRLRTPDSAEVDPLTLVTASASPRA